MKSVPNFNYNKVYNTSYSYDNAFVKCKSLTSIGTFNTLNISNFASVFAGCSLSLLKNIKLKESTSISGFLAYQNITELDIAEYSNANIVNRTNLAALFKYCDVQNQTTITNLDTSNVTYMGSMFIGCTNMPNSIILNTSKVTSMRFMFEMCKDLENVYNYNTQNVVDMSSMFSACTNLKNVPNFNTSKVTSMGDMFKNCTNLTSIPNFDTSNVTSIGGMFAGCTNLTTIPNFNTGKVNTMSDMFDNCINLTLVPNFYLPKATNVERMFRSCTNLVTVPNFNNMIVINMGAMFSLCENLVTVPQFNTSKVNTALSSMFLGCNNLSNESIQNIINMCLNSAITDAKYKNLSATNVYSPFNGTNITSNKYSNRLTELTSAGWVY